MNADSIQYFLNLFLLGWLVFGIILFFILKGDKVIQNIKNITSYIKDLWPDLVTAGSLLVIILVPLVVSVMSLIF